MARKGPNVREFQKRFPDEDSCLNHLMRTRFGDRLTCFKCQKQATYYRTKGRRSFTCERPHLVLAIVTPAITIRRTTTIPPHRIGFIEHLQTF